MEEIELTVENRITILEMEMRLLNEKVQSLVDSITALRDHVHSIGNSVTGKLSLKELEIVLKEYGVKVDVSKQ